jgi:tetratricopeptide (TPR) repeat protein
VPRPGDPHDLVRPYLEALRRLAGFVLYLFCDTAVPEVLLDQPFRSDATIGRDNRATLIARSYLGRALRSSGQLVSAHLVLDETLVEETRLLGAEDIETLTTRAFALTARQHFLSQEDVISQYEEYEADAEQALGPGHRMTLSARNTLALLLRNAGHITRALPMHEAVLADRTRILGPTHPDTIRSRANLAIGYLRAGQGDAAAELLRHAVAPAEERLGKRHHETMTYRNNLGQILRNHGDHGEAIRLLEQVLKDREEVLGPDHFDIFPTRIGLASGYVHDGRNDEAYALVNRAFSANSAADEPPNSVTLGRTYTLLNVMYATGHRRHAKRELTRLYHDAKAVLGPDAELTRTVRRLVRSYPLLPTINRWNSASVRVDPRALRAFTFAAGALSSMLLVGWITGQTYLIHIGLLGISLRLALVLVAVVRVFTSKRRHQRSR